MQDELAGSNVTISTLESQQKMKADEWVAVENKLKEEKAQLEDHLSNLSKQFEDAQNVHANLKVSVDEAKKETAEWKHKYDHLESKVREAEKLNLEQVSSI